MDKIYQLLLLRKKRPGEIKAHPSDGKPEIGQTEWGAQLRCRVHNHAYGGDRKRGWKRRV